MSTWAKVISLKKPRQKNIVRKVTGVLEGRASPWAYVIPKIKADRFLTKKATEAFFDFFLNLDISKTDAELQSEYVGICNYFSYTGLPIGLKPNPEKLGRAVEKFGFMRKTHALNSFDYLTIKNVFSAIEGGTATTTQKAYLRSCLMNEYAAWVTWDEASYGIDDPFTFASEKCANELRACIGLPKTLNKLKQPMMVLRFLSSSVGVLRKPTVADASTHLRFKSPPKPPPKKNNWYGLTRAWPEITGSDVERAKGCFYPRRPEALHEKRKKFPPEITIETYSNKRTDIVV